MIQEFPNLLQKSLCDDIIKIASDKLEVAKTVGKQIEGYRTAESCWLYQVESPALDWIRDFISKAIGYPIENQEDIHIVKYKVGGEYKIHHDYFEENDVDNIGPYGNRTHSFLIYLNDDFEGGETEFPQLDLKIKPEVGKGVCWVNKINGEYFKESEHAGLPVTSGEKWILIIWNREYKFSVPPKQII